MQAKIASVRGSLAAFLLLFAVSCGSGPEFSRRPNFIIIFVDDMGYGDIGPFGSTVNRTPHLDRMAKEGLRLTSFYAAPVCTPSRAALMTGSYPIRNGLQTGSWHPVLMPGDTNGIHEDEVTIAEILQDAGYATGVVGKWHLGDQPEFLPVRHGFDEYYGLPYSNDMIPVPAGSKRPDRNFPPLAMVRNDSPERTVEDQTTLTAEYTREALDFIERHRDGPFFLYLPHSMVHVPLHAGPDFQGRSANGILGDAIEEIDWSTGQVLDKLRELGLEKDTLVLFTSDNGPARGSAGSLRGRKGSTYEGGLRVPTLAWMPGTVPEDSFYIETLSTMDVLPTLAAMAGAKPPADRKIDGHDVSHILRGDLQSLSPYGDFFYYRGYQLRAVRRGVWKLHTNGELYDLGLDVGESVDVAAEHPEVVEELRQALETARRELGDGPADPLRGEPELPAGARPVGTVESPRFLIPRPGQTGEAAHAPVIQGPLPKPETPWIRPENW